MKKKLISLALALIMVLSLLPVTAFATAVSHVTITPPTEYETIYDYLSRIYVEGGDIVDVFLYTVPEGTSNNVEVPSSEYSKAFAEGHYRVEVLMFTDNADGYLHETSDTNFSGTVSGVEPWSTTVGKDTEFAVTGDETGRYLDVMYNLFITHTHEKDTHHDAVAATCEEDGTVEYWECEGCDKYLDKDAKELESIVDPAKGHSFTGDAVCNDDGNTHSFQCVNGDCTAVGVGNVKNDVETCADNNADHKCDECDRVMSECADKDGDGFCDYEGCGKDLSEPECKLPGFIGWIVNSMLRVVRLIIARITFEKYEPVIIGGVIVKIIGDIIK